ncbi:MAG: folate-binding protein YgfZ [Gammaproteobacteria bacterium]|nr:MAG: folate-binding protein YgfZ [Gammaproteobacteria bacterium]
MNNDWKNYLLSKGTQYTEGAAFRFGDDAADNRKAENTDIICDLSQFSTLVVAGDDAKEFMQGQFTNDVEQVDEDNSQISAFCNNKGRMTANFRLFKYQQNYFFSVKNSLVEQSIKHLQNYILRAQVAVQDVSEQLVHLGVSGRNAEKLLSPFIEVPHQGIDSVSFNENYIVIRVASGHDNEKPRYEIFCSLEHAKTLWESVSTQAETVNSASWDYLNIQAGLPFIDASTSEEFVPQMANMELINGVSFTKGCFTGQEIVARMHYLGKLKKRCYKVHIASEDKPAAGDKLFAENARAGQNTGMIIQAEKNPESGYDALAVIQIADTGSNLFLNDAEGPVVTMKELPYTFESSANGSS